MHRCKMTALSKDPEVGARSVLVTRCDGELYVPTCLG